MMSKVSSVFKFIWQEFCFRMSKIFLKIGDWFYRRYINSSKNAE